MSMGFNQNFLVNYSPTVFLRILMEFMDTDPTLIH